MEIIMVSRKVQRYALTFKLSDKRLIDFILEDESDAGGWQLYAEKHFDTISVEELAQILEMIFNEMDIPSIYLNFEDSYVDDLTVRRGDDFVRHIAESLFVSLQVKE